MHPDIALAWLGIAAFEFCVYFCFLRMCGAAYGVFGATRSLVRAAAFGAALLAAGLALTGTTFVAAGLPATFRICSWMLLAPCLLTLASVAGAVLVGRPIHRAQLWQRLELG